VGHRDVFFHRTAVRGGVAWDALTEGMGVTFIEGVDPASGRLRAVDVRPA
jgi:hypothetical protein